MSDSGEGKQVRKANHLAGETSPYLLQHVYNPVDWYPWDAEALQRSHREQKPIFLSVGYSACHWCHVMEHESFENEAIAAMLNEQFIAIKVDREERPDVDQIYMNAVQLMTGRGGWPMSVFLTPDLQPFYGGTYFPPVDRGPMPGFGRILQAVANAWQQRRDELTGQAAQLTQRVREMGAVSPDPGELHAGLLEAAFHALDRSFDDRHGGFGSAPKFPHAMDLRLLLRIWARTGQARALEMVQKTLDHMADGGIYDHLGGGFHRYSVDERWLVPHFEKMLYDNALLVLSYIEGYQATGNKRYAGVVRETLDYVLDQMRGAEGGFFSTEDADSEREEGKFYVWTKQEVDSLLGAELSRTFSYFYDITEFGNWEGKTILNRPKTIAQAAALLDMDAAALVEQLAEGRSKLLAARAARVRPARDEKVLTDWNGLMIDSCAMAGVVLGEPRYLQAAAAAADCLLHRACDASGRLLHSYKDGKARLHAYADDYAFLVNGLITLYEATFESRWYEAACHWARRMLELFWDTESGGLFFTANDHEQLIARNKIVLDNATPSGNSTAALALLRLASLSGQDHWRSHAERILSAFRALMARAPGGCSQLLVALDFYLAEVAQLAVLGDGEQAGSVVSAIYSNFLPNKVVARRCGAETGTKEIPLLDGKRAQDAHATLYVCRDFSCAAPAVGVEACLNAVAALASPRTEE